MARLGGRTKEQLREQCSRAGKAAHASGNAHEWNLETGREAGRKGGLASAAKKREQREAEARRERALAVTALAARRTP